MQTASVSEITELLQEGQLYADFTERSGSGNRERFGIYDVRTSALGPLMIKFNEATRNGGHKVHYIDLRIPNIEFSELFFDCNIPMKINTADPDFVLLRKLIPLISFG